MSEAVDVSYANGNYTPGSETWVIVNASRANQGYLSTGSFYAAQVNAARAAGKKIGHYFFNGNRDPVQCATYFVQNLHDYRHGDLLAIDCEYESGTGTTAWTPAQALAFLTQVVALTGASWLSTAAYINRSIRAQWDWSPVWARGVKKWIAAPDGDPGDWDIWQYSSVGGLDRNHVNDASLAGGGAVPILNTTSEDDEMKLIHDTEQDTIAAVGAGRYFPFGSATNSSLDSAKAVAKVWGAWADVTHAEFMENVRATGADMTRLNVPYPYPVAAPVVQVAAPVVNIDEAAIIKPILAALPAGMDEAKFLADVIAAIRSLKFTAS